jgi:hypothetical protein
MVDAIPSLHVLFSLVLALPYDLTSFLIFSSCRFGFTRRRVVRCHAFFFVSLGPVLRRFLGHNNIQYIYEVYLPTYLYI